jgi:hypothetical protein
MQLSLRMVAVFPILLILLLTVIQAGCAPQVEPAAETTASPTRTTDPTGAAETAESAVATVVASTLQARPTLTPRPSVTPTLAPTQPAEEPAREIPRYSLDVDLSYAARGGTVEQRIEYPNTSGEMLNELRLMVALYDYHGAFTLHGMWWMGGPRDGQAVDRVTREYTQQMVIALPEPLKPGEKIGLRISYSFTLPSQASLRGDRPIPLGHTNRQVNLVDWYPFIPPYRAGTGWIAPLPSYYGEHLVFDLSDFEVNLRLLDDRKDLTVAASALAEEKDGVLVFRRENARNFALSIGHDYKVATAQVGPVTVSSYYFPVHELAGQRVLKTTVESLQLFEQLFGPYPHPSLAVVEADFLDGMEYDGLYFLSRAFYNLHQGRVDDYLVAIAAHETAHMWWYGLIANDQAHEPWLDEALSTYSERLYYEHYYPQALNWWWQYRINYDKPTGWVDSTVYGQQGTTQTYMQYRSAVYLNGALFFEDLRSLMGDEAFFAFLRDYAGQYTGEIAFASDFFDLLRQHTQEDLAPLLKKYFASPP